MLISTRTAPPYSLILIEDISRGDIPEAMGAALIAATPSCIAIGCMAADDAETEISLGKFSEIGTSGQEVFVGVLDTPGCRLVVRNVHGEVLLEMPVSTTQTKLKILANDTFEPDQIAIGVD